MVSSKEGLKPKGPRRGAPTWKKLLRPLTRNRLVLVGTTILILMALMAIFARMVALYDPIAMDMPDALRGPSTQHWFGTDRFGRDILSRVIHGSRISLWVGVASVAISAVVGSVLGLISGYFGGWLDLVISRIMDIFFSFPALLLAITISAMLGPGMTNALLAIAVVYSPVFARIVRGAVLAERGKEYADAARVVGARDRRIIFRHILPNVISPIIVQSSLTLSTAILMESSLSYLGLGTQPPTPSWGTMLSEGRSFLETAPWMSVFPGLAIVVAVVATNLMGDGLREVFDPRMRSA